MIKTKIENKLILEKDLILNNEKEEKIIGQGSYGTVEKIKDKNSNSNYVIKKICKTCNNQYDFIECIEHTSIKELLISYCLPFHKNIIYSSDIYFSENQYEIKMKNKGIDLDIWCKSNSYITRKNNLTYIIFQILNALIHFEKYKIIHGDLKPQNILINPDTLEVTIIDFGGCIVDYTIFKNIKNNQHISLCTYNFSSPEMLALDDNDVDNKELIINTKHDIYSLGMIIKYILLKKYTKEDIYEILDCYKHKVPIFPLDKYIDLSLFDIKFVNLWRSMLITDVSYRPSASELYDNLIFESFKTEKEDKTSHNNNLNNLNTKRSTFNSKLKKLKYPINVKNERNKIIDWMYKICTLHNCIFIFVTSINIFDKYLTIKNLSLNNNYLNINLIAIGSLLISDSLLNLSQIKIETLLDCINNIDSTDNVIYIIDDILETLELNIYNIYERPFDYYLRENEDIKSSHEDIKSSHEDIKSSHENHKDIKLNYNTIKTICKNIENINKPPEYLINLYKGKIPI